MRDNRSVSTEPEQAPHRGDDTVDVTIRRAPRLWVFVALGLVVGVLAALVLTSVFEVDPAVGFTGTFAYLALYTVPISAALFAAVALILDRASRGRARMVRAVHEVAHDEPEAEGADQAPDDAADGDAVPRADGTA